VDGRPVLDGALANPFAHAVMQCLAVAGGHAPAEIELERYRARPIEVDDTAVLRVRTAGGLTIVVAVTLCGDEYLPGEVIVHGERGRAVLGYTEDRLRLPGDPAAREVPGRTGLLENLLAHRAEPAAVPLLAPLERTEPFTALIETIAGAPEPIRIGAGFQRANGEEGARTVTVPGVSRLLQRAAEQLALPSELGAAWAGKPYAVSKGVQTARP
jgi:predicted dehydrogenase